jgi:hypothetical protein
MRSCCGCANAWLRSPAASGISQSRTPESAFGRKEKTRGGLVADDLEAGGLTSIFLLAARDNSPIAAHPEIARVAKAICWPFASGLGARFFVASIHRALHAKRPGCTGRASVLVEEWWT